MSALMLRCDPTGLPLLPSRIRIQPQISASWIRATWNSLRRFCTAAISSIAAGGRIGYVIGAYDQRYVGLGQVRIDLVQVLQLVVRNIGFREQHVHVSWHASRDGMDAELHVNAALGEGIVELANFVLCLRHSHAIARNNDNFVCGGEDSRG